MRRFTSARARANSDRPARVPPVVTVTSLTPKGRRTRAAILIAAKSVFSEHGYTAARMSDIAATAGVSLGAVYRYFTDKDDFFGELFEDLHARFLAATRPNATPATRAQMRESISVANELYFKLYAEERDFMRAVVEASAVNGVYMDRWSAMYEEIANRVLRRLRAVDPQAWGGSGPVDTVFALVCLTEQVAYVNFTRGDTKPRMSAPALAELVTDMWWRSLEPASS